MPEEGEVASTPDKGEATRRRTYLGKEVSVGQDILLIPMSKHYKHVNKYVRTWVAHTSYQSQGATLSNLLTYGQLVKNPRMNKRAAGTWLVNFVVLCLYESEGAVIGGRLCLSSILCGTISAGQYLLIYPQSPSIRKFPLSRMQD